MDENTPVGSAAKKTRDKIDKQYAKLNNDTERKVFLSATKAHIERLANELDGVPNRDMTDDEVTEHAASVAAFAGSLVDSDGSVRKARQGDTVPMGRKDAGLDG